MICNQILEDLLSLQTQKGEGLQKPLILKQATKEEAQAFASKEGEGEVTDLLSAARKMKEEKGKDKLDIYDMAELHGLLEK